MQTQTMEATVENILPLIEKLSWSEKLRLRTALEPTAPVQPVAQAPRGQRVPCEPMPDRTREREWVKQHKQEYAGQWVALNGDQLMAACFTQQDVWDAISDHTPNPPLVLRISAPDDLPYVGML